MTEYEDPVGESQRRRRAAWLLGALVVVAALLVILMLLFFNSAGNGNSTPNAVKPLPTAPPSTAQLQHSSAPPGSSHAPGPGKASSTARSKSPSAAPRTARPRRHSVTVPPRVVHHRVSCPDEARCVAHGDIGNAVAAINAYRVRHGKPPVSGAVTPAAQTCAVTDGGQCIGNWAESQVPKPTGAAAVHQVASLTNLLDPNLASLQVGWAYDPATHAYYFAVIRNDSS